jgi:type IV secretion system protein VirB10
MSFSKVEGERGLPSVGGAGSLQSRVSSLMAVGLMSVLGLGMLAWYYSRAITRQTHAQLNAQEAAKSRVQGDVALPSIGRIVAPRLGAARDTVVEGAQSNLQTVAVEPIPEAVAAPNINSSMAVGLVQPEVRASTGSPALLAKTPAQLALERRLSGQPFAKQTELSPAPQESTASRTESESFGSRNASSEPVVAPASTTTTAARAGTLSALLTPSIEPATEARVLATQRLLLPKGAFIDCTLETAIDTSLPGMTTCITATDTFSVDGKVVLLERGTKLVGETQSGAQQGSSRVFVLWTEARTPTGVVVPLASPGTDELGRSGLPGQVNRHFWDRFGAAILISVIDVALQSSLQSGSGGTVIYSPSTSVDVLTEVLKSTINISSTIAKNQGDRIQVLVARDLDFRSVYELHTR